jgi:hypothetical protein
VSTSDETLNEEALLRAALAMARRGWHVFPCAAGGKRPALRGNWQDLATTDPAVIGRWWSVPYNIGVACGPSGLVVLDLDVPGHGPGQPDGVPDQADGAAALISLCRRRGQPVPAATFTVRTPSGGHRLYFTAADADGVRNSAGRLGPLIDVRAVGGYVVVPPSHIGGKPYAATNAAPPAPLPSWIAALLRQSGPLPAPSSCRRAPKVTDGSAYAMAALRREAERVAMAAEGTRNDTLNRAAFGLGQLVAAGLLPAQDVTTTLAEAAAHAGLPAGEASRTIRSGMTAGARFPRQVTCHARPPELRVPEHRAPGHVPRR